MNDGSSTTDGGVGPRTYIAAGNFTNRGLLAVLDVDQKTVMSDITTDAVTNDPALRRFGDELFIINRDTNKITIVDANTHELLETLDTGANTNPQDVAVDGNRLYVPVYNGSGLVRLTRGTTERVPISLAADDPDGLPNCSSIWRVGQRLYVTCQLLDNSTFAPRGNGKVYVVTTSNESIAFTLNLATKNPQSFLEEVPVGGMNAGSLVVGTYEFGTQIGCLEVITTGATPTTTGCVYTPNALVNRITFTTSTTPPYMFALVRRPTIGGEIQRIDLTTMQVDALPYSQAGQALQDIAGCRDGRLVAAEGPGQGQPAGPPEGLRIYTAPRTESTTSPIPVGINPASWHELSCD